FSALFNSPQTITLTTGELALSDAVTIKGPGSNLLTVSGNNASRIFNTSPAPASAAINISKVTITSGKPGGSGGGQICGAEAIALTNCTLTADTATTGGGIGIVSGGTLSASNCSFTNNTATSNIAGIDVFGGPGAKTILFQCTVSGNKATGSVGGIYATNYLL